MFALLALVAFIIAAVLEAVKQPEHVRLLALIGLALVAGHLVWAIPLGRRTP